MFNRLHSHAADADVLDRLVVAATYPVDATRQHPWRVADLAGTLTIELGYAKGEADLVRGAARFHDIGKIDVSPNILGKPGSLNDIERRLMQRHAEMGARILAAGRSPLLRLATVIASTHHEWWDGGGYPRGLHGAQIPIAGRIVSVADAWDAMTSDRPYRRSRGPEDALLELQACAGTQFDPQVVAAFTRVYDTSGGLVARQRVS